MVMQPNIRIRPARPNDQNFVLSLAPRFADIPPPALVATDSIKAGSHRFLVEAMEEHGRAATVLIAERDGEPAGVAVLWVQPTAHARLPVAYLSDLAVASHHEGVGVARALIDACKAWAHQKGLPQVNLRVFASNRRARRLYGAAGFTPETVEMVASVQGSAPELSSLPPLDRLLRIMATLRSPDGGCPWDREQTFATIAPYTIEEAYEVAEAIAEGDMSALRDELGDLLLQVVFHARMAEEEGLFDFEDVAATIADKMIRRHPNVFAGRAVADAAAQTRAWEAIKAAERTAKAAKAGSVPSALDGVGVALPALTRAVKLQARAARVGFDWTTVPPIFDKLDEEVAELKAELAEPTPDPTRIAEEMGDVLFVIANLARRLGVDPEAALRAGNAKFERRFRMMESLAEAGLDGLDLDAQEALWQRAKALETEG